MDDKSRRKHSPSHKTSGDGKWPKGVAFFDMMPATSREDIAEHFQGADDVIAFVDHHAFSVSGMGGIGYL